MEVFYLFCVFVVFVQGLELILYLTPSLPSHEIIIFLSACFPALLFFILNYFGMEFTWLLESVWRFGSGWILCSILFYLYFSWRANTKFPPLLVPWRRRGQSLSTMICWPMPIWGLVAVVCLLSNKWTRWPYILWAFYIVKFDKTSSTGGWKKRKWWTDSLMFHLCCEFFPCKLVKEADLDPTKTYIFGYHPHGILGIGAWCQFCTEGTGLAKLFPGMEIRLLTLKQIFWLPIFRQFLLMCGGCDVSKQSIATLLSKPGNAVVIIVGGAAEALDASPGTLDLTLQKRKGFIKQALVHGSNLVPVLSFGENDIFETVAGDEHKALKSIQTRLKQIFKYAMPIFYGRGMLNYSFGLLPFRRPINTVVGTPIDIPEKIKDPTNEMIEELHKKYVEGLQTIYDKYKDEFAPNRKRDMIIK
mmetsp:Transcript_6004/g.7934  ORF Transcript_6004/g.7934 Transcript_6004/m.7934 type:complete len:416 (+) Transcript_6004:150-1397(+)